MPGEVHIHPVKMRNASGKIVVKNMMMYHRKDGQHVVHGLNHAEYSPERDERKVYDPPNGRQPKTRVNKSGKPGKDTRRGVKYQKHVPGYPHVGDKGKNGKV